MSNSIKPQTLESSELLRMDQGVRWFHNINWTTGGGSAVDLNKWSIVADFYWKDTFARRYDLDHTTPVMTSPTATPTGTAGQFEIDVPEAVTDALDMSKIIMGKGELAIRVIATCTADDMDYVVGQKVAIVTGTIPIYSRSAGA